MSDTVIAGSRGRALQRKKVRSDAWSKAGRIEFLERLAVTANVSQSAEACGVGLRTAYRWCQKDPAFRAAWQEALEAGYGRVEEELLAHAMGAPAGDYAIDAAAAEPPRPFDPELALQILRMRNVAGSRRPNSRVTAAVPLEELRRVLKHKLDMLAKRLGNMR